MPLTMVADYFLWRRMLPPGIARLAIIFALGAAIAAPIAIWCAKITARQNKYSAFAAMFVLLSALTVALTAVIFAFDFWWYFAQWHGQTLSKLWIIQLVYTFASAIYQFLVSGLRLYLPFGLVALAIASMWVSRRIMR